MNLRDFDFSLPDAAIARYPLEKRSDSRLLCLSNSDMTHRYFYQVIDLLSPGDLLIFNDTKVIPARLYGHKETGGKVEILVERLLDEKRMLAQTRSSKGLKCGQSIFIKDKPIFKVLAKHDSFYELLYLNKTQLLVDFLMHQGDIPLPPYLARQAEESDKDRYQTIYAKHQGSVAAPTAGFHFDEALLSELQNKKISFGYLTLHIGAGTFLPVRVDNIHEHKMHAEYFTVSPFLCEQIKLTKANGKKVIAVGTTTLRALESAVCDGEVKPYCGETTIFITPGHQFNSVDALITNLHLPQSTLLMLVCAFGGYKKVMAAYHAAIQHRYRFYSYGDAMWVSRDAPHIKEQLRL